MFKRLLCVFLLLLLRCRNLNHSTQWDGEMRNRNIQMGQRKAMMKLNAKKIIESNGIDGVNSNSYAMRRVLCSRIRMRCHKLIYLASVSLSDCMSVCNNVTFWQLLFFVFFCSSTNEFHSCIHCVLCRSYVDVRVFFAMLCT